MENDASQPAIRPNPESLFRYSLLSQVLNHEHRGLARPQAIAEVAEKYKKEGKLDIHAKYAAMVESVDDSTGQLLATLEELGIDDRTVPGGLDPPFFDQPLQPGAGERRKGVGEQPVQSPAGLVLGNLHGVSGYGHQIGD